MRMLPEFRNSITLFRFSWHRLHLIKPRPNQKKYLGLVIDHDLTMKEATSAGVKAIKFAHSKMTATIHSLLQIPSRQTHAALAPNMRLQMWKSCVLTQAQENLTYLHMKDQVQLWQNEINKSLKIVFRHFEQPTPLALDLGIPPLALHQAVQLARLHYRYTKAQQTFLPEQQAVYLPCVKQRGGAESPLSTKSAPVAGTTRRGKERRKRGAWKRDPTV